MGGWVALILPFDNRAIKLKPSCASKVPLSLAVNICADVSELEASEELLLDLLGRAGILRSDFTCVEEFSASHSSSCSLLALLLLFQSGTLQCVLERIRGGVSAEMRGGDKG